MDRFMRRGRGRIELGRIDIDVLMREYDTKR
jgi:hypothetical protein